MKKATIILFAMFVALGSVGFVCAQQAAQPAKSEASAKKEEAKVPRVVGKVISVDATAGTITVKDRSGNTETLVVDKTAKIRKTIDITLGDISVGDTAMVQYKTEAGKKIATSISTRK